MKRRQRLLRLRLDRHGPDIIVARRLEQALGVGAIGLVADDVRPHGVRGQEHDSVAVRLRVPAPVVGRPTRFHQDRRRRRLAQVPAKPSPREPMAPAHQSWVLRDSYLEYGLGHVHRDRRRIHRTPPSKGSLDARRLWHTMPFKSREESIPSLERPGTNRSCRAERWTAGRSTPRPLT